VCVCASLSLSLSLFPTHLTLILSLSLSLSLRYFIHGRTGETLWESDLRQRLLQESAGGGGGGGFSPAPASPAGRQVQAGLAFRKGSSANDVGSDGDEGDGVDMAAAEIWLAMQTLRACLISFFGKNDPERLVEVENLLHTHKGKEVQLLEELCTKYDVPVAPEKSNYARKLDELRGAGGAGGLSGGGSAAAASPLRSTGSGLSSDFKLGASTPVAERGAGGMTNPNTPGAGGVPGGMSTEMVQVRACVLWGLFACLSVSQSFAF